MFAEKQKVNKQYTGGLTWNVYNKQKRIENNAKSKRKMTK